jgi:hypothetical protein
VYADLLVSPLRGSALAPADRCGRQDGAESDDGFKQLTGVDERDSGWEDDHPRFRVYLHGSGETSTWGWTDTYDITGADVLQVIDWLSAKLRTG